MNRVRKKIVKPKCFLLYPDPWSSDSDLSDISPVEDEYAKIDKSERRQREAPDIGDVTAPIATDVKPTATVNVTNSVTSVNATSMNNVTSVNTVTSVIGVNTSPGPVMPSAAPVAAVYQIAVAVTTVPPTNVTDTL